MINLHSNQNKMKTDLSSFIHSKTQASAACLNPCAQETETDSQGLLAKQSAYVSELQDQCKTLSRKTSENG